MRLHLTYDDAAKLAAMFPHPTAKLTGCSSPRDGVLTVELEADLSQANSMLGGNATVAVDLHVEVSSPLRLAIKLGDLKFSGIAIPRLMQPMIRKMLFQQLKSTDNLEVDGRSETITFVLPQTAYARFQSLTVNPTGIDLLLDVV